MRCIVGRFVSVLAVSFKQAAIQSQSVQVFGCINYIPLKFHWDLHIITLAFFSGDDSNDPFGNAILAARVGRARLICCFGTRQDRPKSLLPYSLRQLSHLNRLVEDPRAPTHAWNELYGAMRVAANVFGRRNFSLCLTCTHTSHCVTSWVIPSISNRIAAGCRCANRRCHSLDSETVFGPGRAVAATMDLPSSSLSSFLDLGTRGPRRCGWQFGLLQFGFDL